MQKLNLHRYEEMFVTRPLQARKTLGEMNFVELPPNSYHLWIEKDWFERYKKFDILVFKNGSWIPNLDRLDELRTLDVLYREHEWKRYGHEKIVEVQMEGLLDKEPEKDKPYYDF